MSERDDYDEPGPEREPPTLRRLVGIVGLMVVVWFCAYRVYEWLFTVLD